MRHRQQYLRSAIGEDRTVHKILPAEMHVRHKTVEVCRLGERISGFHFIVRIAGRNDKSGFENRPGYDPVFDGSLRKDQAYSADVFAGGALPRVVHLKKKNRINRDLFWQTLRI